MRLRYRDQKKEDNNQWIKGYEHNLSLLLDALKDEFMTINKDRSLQYAATKTLLWINIIFIGLSIKVIEYSPSIYLLITFLFFSSLALLITLFSMLEGKYNVYPSIGRPKKFTIINNDEWIKVQGYLTSIYSYRRAIKYNGINIIKRAKWIRNAKYLSLISFIFLLILAMSTLNKGKDMAEKPKTPVIPVVKPTESKRSNESATVPRVNPVVRDLNKSKK